MSDDKKYTGRVIWFNKGFGFIERVGLPDLFVHFSDINSDGFKNLKKDQKVEFGIGKNNRGEDKATEVTVIS